MGRRPSRAVLLVLFLLVASAPAGLARVSRERLPFSYEMDRTTGNGSASAIVTTADGTPHILYPGPGLSLHHAWRRNGGWRDEVVDPRYTFNSVQPIAADALGRLHAAYSAQVGDVYDDHVVMYARRDEAGWSLTEIAPGWRPILYLGTDDLPRVVFQGPERVEVATFDGAQWVRGDFGPAPPDSIRPNCVVQDSAGALHVLADRGDGVGGDYATDASGTWVRSSGWAWSLALDPAGHPHLGTGATTGVENAWDRLVHRWFDGSEWRSEDVFEWGVPSRWRDAPQIASDAEGHLFLAFYQQEEFPDVATATIRLAVRDGFGWREFPVGRAWNSFPPPPTVADDGSVHLTWGGAYARVALPDLAVEGDRLTAGPDGEGARVEGGIDVRNLGAGRSRAARLRFYLSDDDALDESDEPLGGARRVGSLAPGGRARIPVALRVPGPVAGKRLLAVVDPAGRLRDLDRLNNTVALPLGE